MTTHRPRSFGAHFVAAVNRSGVAAILLLPMACGPTLRMDPGTPITMKRGYCLMNPEYVQAGRARSRSDTLDKLSNYEEAAPHVSAGRALTIGGSVGAVAGGGLLGYGIGAAVSDSPGMSQTASTALMVSGAALAAVSIGVCLVGENQYQRAVEAYNARLIGRGGAMDTDDEEPNEDVDKYPESPAAGAAPADTQPSELP